MAAPASVTDERPRGQHLGRLGGPSREHANSWCRERRRANRSGRYRLRSGARPVTTLDRLRGCGVWRRPDVEAVAVVRDSEGLAHLSGVQSCGSVWACAVCSAAIRQGRAVEVERIAKAHLAAGGGIVFATLTVPHDDGEALAELLDTVIVGWSQMRKHRAVRRLAASLGWDGFVRAVEVTHGRNGWHPHLHVLLLLERPVSTDECAALQSAMHAAWSAFAVGRSRRPPLAGIGVRCQVVTADDRGAEALAAYLSKVQDSLGDERDLALEMVRGDLKTGRSKVSRTPFDLLGDAIAGDARSLALWREYERATKGRRCLEKSRGLAKRYGVDELDDAQLVDAPVVVETVAEFSEREWALLVTYRAQCRVLEAAEDRGAAGVWELLRALERRAAFDARRGNLSRPIPPPAPASL